MILETSFIIDHMNGKKEAVDKIKELIERGVTTTIAAPSIFEIFSGLAQSSKKALEKEKIKRVLQEQSILSLDEQCARQAGNIHGQLVISRKNIGAVVQLG